MHAFKIRRDEDYVAGTSGRAQRKPAAADATMLAHPSPARDMQVGLAAALAMPAASRPGWSPRRRFAVVTVAALALWLPLIAPAILLLR